jgi:hypothetical protein
MSAITPAVAPSGRRFGTGMLAAALVAGVLAGSGITLGAGRLTGGAEISAESAGISSAMTPVREASAAVAVSGAISPALTPVREASAAVAVSGAISPALTQVREASAPVSGGITQALTSVREASGR